MEKESRKEREREREGERERERERERESEREREGDSLQTVYGKIALPGNWKIRPERCIENKDEMKM